MKKLLIILTFITVSAYCAEKKEKAEAQDTPMRAQNAGVKRKPKTSDKLKQYLRTEKRQKHLTIKSLITDLENSRGNFGDIIINEMKEMLSKNKDNINARDIHEWTPLLHIVRMGKENESDEVRIAEFVKWLIENGAEVTNKSLVLALSSNNPNLTVIKLLIEKGADVNTTYIKEIENMTPLLGLMFNLNIYNAMMKIDKWKAVAKELLINGANFKTAQFQKWFPERSLEPEAKTLNEVIQEIINEYRQKIDNYNTNLRQTLNQVFMPRQKDEILPPELINIMNSYDPFITYRDDQILDNIMEIRYVLDELSPKQKEIYEQKQKMQQQDQPAAAAAARPIAPAQQAAAAMQD